MNEHPFFKGPLCLDPRFCPLQESGHSDPGPVLPHPKALKYGFSGP